MTGMMLAAPRDLLHAAGLTHGNAPPEVVIALGAIVGAGFLYAMGVSRLWARAGTGAGISRTQAGAYGAALVLVAVALVALPLSEVTERFQGHMAQHLLLMDAAAALAALGAAPLAFAWGLRRQRRVLRWWRRAARQSGVRALTSAPALVALHVAVLWGWHMPALYEVAEGSALVHGAQHVTMSGVAFLLWLRVVALVRGGPHRLPIAAGMLFAVMVSGLALGAFLTFARSPLYPSAAQAGGEAALADQQLGGLLMLMLAGLVYVGAMIAIGLRLLGSPVSDRPLLTGGDA